MIAESHLNITDFVTAEADRKILLAILRDPNASANIDWEALAAELSTDTVTCTVGALRKHISRIKVAVKDVNGYAVIHKTASCFTDLPVY